LRKLTLFFTVLLGLAFIAYLTNNENPSSVQIKEQQPIHKVKRTLLSDDNLAENSPVVLNETYSVPVEKDTELNEAAIEWAEDVSDIQKYANKEDTNRVLPFEQQPVDEAWAFEFSDEIFVLFANHPELTDIYVKNTQCREYTCRIELFTDDSDAIETAQRIGSILKADENWQNNDFYFHNDVESGVISIEIDNTKRLE